MKITLTDINKYYRKKEVLHNLSLDVNLADHKLLGLVGPNGAGKSTLMRVLSGILLPTNGRLDTTINENPVKNYQRWAMGNVMYVPAGDRGLVNRLTIKQNFKYFCTLKGVDYKKNMSTFFYFAEKLKLENLLNRDFENMSTGQKKASALLVSLAIGTDVLLLDEPSSGLDIDAQNHLLETLKLVKNDTTEKIIISSHDVNLLTSICEEYVFLREGNLVTNINSVMSQEQLVNEYHEKIQ